MIELAIVNDKELVLLDGNPICQMIEGQTAAPSWDPDPDGCTCCTCRTIHRAVQEGNLLSRRKPDPSWLLSQMGTWLHGEYPELFPRLLEEEFFARSTG